MMYSIPATSMPAAKANRVLRNSYMLLAITLLPSIAGAYLGALFPLMAQLGGIMTVVVFLGAMFGIQSMVIKNRHSVAGIGWLLLFTFVMGYFTGPLVGFALGSFSNGAELVAMAIGGTAALFFILAGYATVTKRNLASPSIGKMLMIGMVMLFAISLMNIFIQAPAVMLAVSTLFILIASGFIVFTINNVVRGGQDNYIMVTMTLYIMLLNLFQSLLHLLMMFSGNRE
ncbi:Bax inhibitor-1 family protein [Candidatus Persebacteraceae bacterium Df01]|jgi:modulator of FtsH protease|uniref:Bax inhibitor-1 family protein n=1 Tax=Candidatus Doriopsillibacter californiensis TaxID=2970740 RepID=A0ABT7QJX3_9GAMM|nr:Bax inhibitor-1 family protein [Candidatus Persebacteraceae bacterium Df01]